MTMTSIPEWLGIAEEVDSMKIQRR